MTGILNLLAGSISSAIKDGYFNLVSLLLPGNGTNGAQNNTFLDSSSNNFTITRNGNTTQGTFSPFSQTGWSNFFNGSSDYLQAGTTATDFLCTGSTSGLAATFDGWVFPTSWNGNSGENNNPIWAKGGTYISVGLFNGAIQFYWWNGSTGTTITSSSSISLNAWSYIAVTISGSTVTFYINGVLAGSGTMGSGIATAGAGQGDFIGSARDGSPTYFAGYISNWRISNTVRSISSIPTAALFSDANTRLLTCQNNRFIDNSSNAFSITVNGTPSVQPFSPFAPTAAYSAATNGGSGYFDGNGDFLTAPASSSWLFNGDACIEAWVYRAADTDGIIFATGGASSADQFAIFVSEGLWWGLTAQTGLPKPRINTWAHCVVTRSGSTIRRFIDGVLVSTGTNASAIGTSSSTAYIGSRSGVSNYFNGYISGLRVINGSIPTSYQTSSTTTSTQIFTPPTAPFTTTSQGATSGDVKLLLNFTNAGIIDSTGDTVLETAGNAQISTTQSKFGGSSMSFNGTNSYLRPNSGNIFNFGTGDFTIEFWLYLNSTAAQMALIDCRPGSAGDYILFDYDPTAKLRLFVNTTTVLSGSTLATGQWYHIALARSGSTVRYFIDGTQGASATMTTNLLSAANPYIGSNYVPGSYLNGYIDDLRVTKGYARYTANFTPPTAAFALQ